MIYYFITFPINAIAFLDVGSLYIVNSTNINVNSGTEADSPIQANTLILKYATLPMLFFQYGRNSTHGK
jgi:hypothetical protein